MNGRSRSPLNYTINTEARKAMVKVKLALEQAMEAQEGNRGIALLFLYPWRQMGQMVKPRPGRFIPGKETRYPLYTQPVLTGAENFAHPPEIRSRP